MDTANSNALYNGYDVEMTPLALDKEGSVSQKELSPAPHTNLEAQEEALVNSRAFLFLNAFSYFLYFYISLLIKYSTSIIIYTNLHRSVTDTIETYIALYVTYGTILILITIGFTSFLLFIPAMETLLRNLKWTFSMVILLPILSFIISATLVCFIDDVYIILYMFLGNVFSFGIYRVVYMYFRDTFSEKQKFQLFFNIFPKLIIVGILIISKIEAIVLGLLLNVESFREIITSIYTCRL